ncbi:chemotaxis protein CheW [Fulvivirga ulvae]|uniref:chemotaxis protein CheA n=1 Tax=Fulvivirga ulvae TaxID=2904245 RepID=UPI001F2C77EA|nr:chemotaxis protein CheW [Fulvivirga ulvae]UII33335.1 chemotaxis protein CheW [Fulvivirga ulvae]
MNDRDKEYRVIFLAEAQQSYDQISTDIVKLEKDPGNENIVDEIFRLLHNMKANASTMDLDAIAELSHCLENVFSSIRTGELVFEGNKVNLIFKAIDYLGYLINNIGKSQRQIHNDELLADLNDLVVKGEVPAEASQEHTSSFISKKLHLSDSVSIPVRKLDDLLNLVGELIISRDHLINFAELSENQQMKHITQSLSRIADSIQETVMTARLVTVSSLFNKFPKVIRDIASDENKKVNLSITGTDTTIDRNVLKVISDIMIHLIRNAIIHGIEDPDERIKRKKSEEGKVEISAISEKGLVFISISDDGRGIDTKAIKAKAIKKDIISQSRARGLGERETLGLLFVPGFSMADKVTEYAGRGVGLDIVKRVIDSIGGDLRIESKVGEGTRFIMSLPISMAVKAALLFKVSDNNFALPLLNIHVVVTVSRDMIHNVGEVLVLEHKNEMIELIYLHDFLFKELDYSSHINLKREVMDVIVVWYNNKKYGLVVDQLLRQQEIMIKPLQNPLDDNTLFSGITLLGSGEVCYVLDVAGTSKAYEQKDNKVQLH